MPKVVDWVKLDKNGVEGGSEGIVYKYFDDNGALPSGNFNKEDIAGVWIVIDGKVDSDNDNIIYAYREVDDTTLVKSPINNFDKKDYIIDYSENPNALDIHQDSPFDVLVRKNGYNFKVNFDVDLDGYKYTGVLGLKLNNNLFLGFESNKWELIDIIF